MSAGRHLHIDPVGGVAGDMLMAALVDLGAELEPIAATVSAVVGEPVMLAVSEVMRGLFRGLHLQVLTADGALAEAAPSAPVPPAPRFRRAPELDHGHGHDHGHTHDHGHDHGHDAAHDHGHSHGSDHDHGHTHGRTWRDIRSLLQSAEVPEGVRARALAVFEKLAIAEARVHGMELEDVGFHEVGAVDAIADVLGVCLALEQLGVASLSCSALPIASGTTRADHGLIPLPAPATLLLLEGWPVRPGIPGFEQVTPTGAALVTALAAPSEPPAMQLSAVGTGAGSKDTKASPNVLRAMLGSTAAPSSPELVEVITAQLDDLAGEHLPPLIDALLDAGALDAMASPVLMKKGRSGLQVTALCTEAHADTVIRAFLRHSSSFGVRRHPTRRVVLERWHETVETAHGPVRIKPGALDGEILQVAPEFSDVQERAREHGLPTPRVHSEALAAWWSRAEER